MVAVTLNNWEYIWTICQESLGSDPNPTDPTVLMILKIIYQITTGTPMPSLLFPAPGPKSDTLYFSEVELFAILWVLCRYQRFTTGNEAVENQKLCDHFRKALCEFPSI